MSDVFRSVVCGVDGSEEGLAAARQAARLADLDGSLTLVGVEETALAVHAGWGATAVMAQLSAETKAAVDTAVAACAHIHAAEAVLAEGDPAAVLLEEAGRRGASLLAVGVHGHRRTLGILLGSVTTTLVHEAPCSVLVARPVEGRWPRQLVVGFDGSHEARIALAAARELAARLNVEVRTIEERQRDAADALVAAAEPSDLLVVGSRGLKGFRALGSVSERVAHAARCPVLVVRAQRGDLS